jgi:hypothetical protein
VNFYLVIIESFGGFWGKKLLNFGKFVPNLHNHKFEGKKNPGHKGGQTTIVAFVSSSNMQTVSGKKRTWNQLHALY